MFYLLTYLIAIVLGRRRYFCSVC